MINKIPCKLSTYSEVNPNSNLMKVKLMVMHDGKNFNGSSFSLESMKNAEETIKNTPILAFTVRDEEGNAEDFDGHNMETSLVCGEDGYELKTTYLETPIGVIPETCNPHYEVINGKNYFVVEGFIWKSYSNGSYKLIENNEFKGVSMEIRVEDGDFNFEEDAYEIKKYQYEGVTVLGDNVPPAMESCKIMKYSSNMNEYKKTLAEIYQEIYMLEEREVYEMEENQIVEEVVETVEETTPETTEFSEEVVETVEEPKEEVEKEFEVKKEEDETDKEDEVEDDEVEEETKEDEDDEEEKYKKKKRCSQEEFSLECFNIFFEEVPATVEEVCTSLKEMFESLNAELNVLKEFKANYEKSLLVEEVESIVSEFTFEDEEVTELKTKALNGEISTKEFKKELFALEGMKIHNEKKKFSTEVIKPSAKISVVDETKEYEPYGGLFSKYKK